MPPETRSTAGLTALLVTVLSYLLWRSLGAGPGFLLSGLVWWICLMLLLVAATAPPVWWFHRRSGSRPEPAGEAAVPRREGPSGIRPALIGLAAVVALTEVLLLTAPNLAVHAPLDFNWQGKLVSLAVAAIFVALWSGLSRREVGLTVPGWSGWWPALAVTGAALLFWAAVAGQSPPFPEATAEAFLFQATMPSLEEELVWRGILWALVLQALPRTRRFGGQGWALLVTTLGFGLIHGLVFDAHLVPALDPPLFLFSGLAGLALGWIRMRSGSILPAMAAHSGINLSAVVVTALVA